MLDMKYWLNYPGATNEIVAEVQKIRKELEQIADRETACHWLINSPGGKGWETELPTEEEWKTYIRIGHIILAGGKQMLAVGKRINGVWTIKTKRGTYQGPTPEYMELDVEKWRLDEQIEADKWRIDELIDDLMNDFVIKVTWADAELIAKQLRDTHGIVDFRISVDGDELHMTRG